MECDTYQEQISLWIDNRLTQGEIRRLEAHTAACPTCRAVHDNLQRMDRLLRSAPMISPTPGFTTRFTSRLAAHRRRRHTWAGLAILTLVTLALLLGTMILVGISSVALWQSLSASGLLTQGIGLLLDVGKAMAASLRLVWVVISAFAQGLRQPAFIAYAIATATLVVAWTQIVSRRILSHRPVSINSHG